MTASVLKYLLALYLAIIYSWQLSSSEKSLVEKKVHPCISRILQISVTIVGPPPPLLKGEVGNKTFKKLSDLEGGTKCFARK